MTVCPKLAIQRAINASQKPGGTSADLFATMDAIALKDFSAIPSEIPVSVRACMECSDSRCDGESVVCAYDSESEVIIQSGVA